MTAPIFEFDRELSRLRQRAARQRREEGLAAWSSTIDEVVDRIDKIGALPPSSVQDLMLQFRAILWLIEFNESLLDQDDLRRLRRFKRALKLVAVG